MANGLYSNDELIDSLIMDCNDAVKAVAGGQMIQWCKTMYEMVVKLANLKNGVKNDLKNRDENIAILKQMLKDAGIEMQEIDISELAGKEEAEEKRGVTDGE